jgi:hypothetical protein
VGTDSSFGRPTASAAGSTNRGLLPVLEFCHPGLACSRPRGTCGRYPPAQRRSRLSARKERSQLSLASSRPPTKSVAARTFHTS